MYLHCKHTRPVLQEIYEETFIYSFRYILINSLYQVFTCDNIISNALQVPQWSL